VVGGFKQEDIDKVPMQANLEFEPLSCWPRVLFLPGFLDLARRGFHVGSVSGQGLTATCPRGLHGSIGETLFYGSKEKGLRCHEEAAEQEDPRARGVE
jgi:hypothetical protein